MKFFYDFVKDCYQLFARGETIKQLEQEKKELSDALKLLRDTNPLLSEQCLKLENSTSELKEFIGALLLIIDTHLFDGAGDLGLLPDNIGNKQGDVIKKISELLEQKRNYLEKHNKILFDEKTGTWLDTESKQRYCPACKGNHNKLSPLKAGDAGWTCSVCTAFLANPDYQDDVPISTGSRINLDGFI
jgi:ribosomal protein L37AE/L43A